jgi:hypothetical protein
MDPTIRTYEISQNRETTFAIEKNQVLAVTMTKLISKISKQVNTACHQVVVAGLNKHNVCPILRERIVKAAQLQMMEDFAKCNFKMSGNYYYSVESSHIIFFDDFLNDIFFVPTSEVDNLTEEEKQTRFTKEELDRVVSEYQSLLAANENS